MARPLKQGLDYFPHDTDAHTDEKMQALISLHGMVGLGVYWVLVEKIYRTEEGYLEVGSTWKREVHAGYMRITLDQFDSILTAMFNIGLFKRELYEKENKLTSDGILERREYLLKRRLGMREKRGTTKKGMSPAAEKGYAGKLAEKYPETALHKATQVLNNRKVGVT